MDKVEEKRTPKIFSMEFYVETKARNNDNQHVKESKNVHQLHHIIGYILLALFLGI